MSDQALSSAANDPAIAARAAELLEAHQLAIWARTDRLFAGLLVFEWLGGIALALWRSPRTWSGSTSHLHPHVVAAIVLGAAIISLPVALILFRAGRVINRHVVAVAQMLMSALLIHLGDGRIEMHFHVFGSLAFLAFYRDWRVLITASAVVALDHLFRGIFIPQSVYGVLSATAWRTLEHAGWVVFEDVFLIASCVQGVREMRGIADNRALLEHSYHTVEEKVRERTQQLKDAQQSLVKVARSAGMAEIATSVLHNVGNVLNSVNVSASVAAEKVRNSEIATLAKVGQLISSRQDDLPAFLTADERGKHIPGFIVELAQCLGQEQTALLDEISSLTRGIEHIKEIVAAQQSLAKRGNVRTLAEPSKVFETAMTMQGAVSTGATIEFVRRFENIPAVPLDEHKILQILINLISNARHAVNADSAVQKQITLVTQPIDRAGEPWIQFQVIDTGVGIAPEHLTAIFSHGFTTRQDGHGFGLHSAANAAREMGGSLTAGSDGVGKGAVFTLQLPLVAIEAGELCSQ